MAEKDGRKNHSFREFGGVNTQSARQTIQDTEFSWLEDVMPIGFGNMPVVPGPSSAFYTLSGGESCYYIETANIQNAGVPTEYLFIFCTSGDAFMVQVQAPYTVTQIGTSGKFSGYGCRIAQWKDDRILIVDPVKGYFDFGFSVIANSFTGTITGTTTLTVSSVTGTIAIGQPLYYPSGTQIATITGGSGTTWTITSTTNVGPVTMYSGGFTLTSYAGTVFSVAVTAAGSGFTNATTTTITQAGGGYTTPATYSCYIGVQSFTLTSPGTLYSVGDVISPVGGTTINSQIAQFTVAAIDAVATGVITAINITVPGVYSIAPSPLTGVATTVSHGAGSGAVVTLNYGIVSVAVVTPGAGYTSDPTTSPNSLTIAGGGSGTGAILTGYLSSSSPGTAIATYAGRVWIANGRTIVYSAPDSYQDFTTTSLGGSLIMSDSTLRSQIYQLFSANNYMYIFGVDSINAISGVAIQPSTATSAAITIFTNSNLTPSIGTDMQSAILANYRTIMFANDYGVFGLNGVSPVKMSDALDGMFPDINLAQSISCGTAIIYNIQCQCFLVSYNDPILGSVRPLLMVYFNKKWFFSTQVTGATFVATGLYNGTPTLFATDGTSVYRCFDQTTQSHAHEIQTKLWDFGSPLITKQAFKLAIESVSPTVNATINVGIDTEIKSLPYLFTAGNSMTWTNNTGGIISWTNNLGSVITWSVAGYVMLRTDVSNTGNYLGVTITSSSNNLTYAGLHLQYEARTPWTGAPF